MHCGGIVLSRTNCMQGNGIGEGGARDLARALELNTCLLHLDVRVCRRKEGGLSASEQDLALMSTHECM